MRRKRWEYIFTSIFGLAFGIFMLCISVPEYRIIQDYTFKTRIGLLYSYNQDPSDRFDFTFQEDTLRVYNLSEILFPDTDFDGLYATDLATDTFEIIYEQHSLDVFGLRTGSTIFLSKDVAHQTSLNNQLLGIGLGGFFAIAGLIMFVVGVRGQKEETLDPEILKAKNLREIIAWGKTEIWLLTFGSYLLVLLKSIDAIVEHNMNISEGLRNLYEKNLTLEINYYHVLGVLAFIALEGCGYLILRSNLNKIGSSSDKRANVVHLNSGLHYNLLIQFVTTQAVLTLLHFYGSGLVFIGLTLYLLAKVFVLYQIRSDEMKQINLNE